MNLEHDGCLVRMPEPYPILVWHYSDYDLGSWIWFCVGCNQEVGQDYFSPSQKLTCWHCDHELTVHSRTSKTVGKPYPKGHECDVPYEFMVTLTNAPTRAELLMGYDAHSTKLWDDLIRLRGVVASLMKELDSLTSDHPERVHFTAMKLERAAKDVEMKARQYDTYQKDWKKRGLDG